jgi:hypothetical protein
MSQEVSLAVIDTQDRGQGEWRAELHDFLIELQDSNCAIIGSFISVPSPARLTLRSSNLCRACQDFMPRSSRAMVLDALRESHR